MTAPELQRMTWDQAAILGLHPANAFVALGIPAGTIRWWASEGIIRPAGIGPRGNKLYPMREVINAKKRHETTSL